MSRVFFKMTGLLILGSLTGCADMETPMVVRHKALLAEQRGDYETALAIRNAFIEQNPEYRFLAEVYLEQGVTQLEQGNLQESLAYLNKAIEEDDRYLDAYVRRCEVNSLLKNNEQAIEDGRRAVELSIADRQLSQVFYHQGNAHADIQRPNHAIVEWQLALLLNPDHLDAFGKLSQAYVNARRFEEALELIEKSLKHNDRFALKHLMYSQVLVNLDRRAEAEKALARARELNLGDELEVPESVDALLIAEEIPAAPLAYSAAHAPAENTPAKSAEAAESEKTKATTDVETTPVVVPESEPVAEEMPVPQPVETSPAGIVLPPLEAPRSKASETTPETDSETNSNSETQNFQSQQSLPFRAFLGSSPTADEKPVSVSVQEQAIKVARQFLEEQGIRCLKSPRQANLLLCREGGESFEVQVKVMTDPQSWRFELTQQELKELATLSPPRGMLVVTEVDSTPVPGQETSGRVAAYAKSWRPDVTRLSAQTYTYQVPDISEVR